MAIYSSAARNAIAAALASMLNGSRLFIMSTTGRTLAVVAMPQVTSPSEGVLEAGRFAPADVVSTGDAFRYEIQQPSGLVVLSGAVAELGIKETGFKEGGRVFVDSFVLTV